MKHSTITAISLLAIAILITSACGKKQGPTDIVFQDPGQAIEDARQIIVEKLKNPELYKDWVPPEDLPASLRIAGLKCAVVHNDHVDLPIMRIPDWAVGARIWSKNAAREHADKQTAYPEIFFFTYSNDFSDSPENIW